MDMVIENSLSLTLRMSKYFVFTSSFFCNDEKITQNLHWHGDWKFFVIDVENVQNLHVDVHVNLKSKYWILWFFDDNDGNDYMTMAMAT